MYYYWLCHCHCKLRRTAGGIGELVITIGYVIAIANYDELLVALANWLLLLVMSLPLQITTNCWWH